MVRTQQGLIFAAIVWLSTTGSAFDQSTYDLVKIVSERKRYMFEMQQAFWPLFNINNGRSTDLVAAADAARSIDEKFVRFLALLPEGTAGGEVPGSRARPEIWTEPSKFSAAVEGLHSATARLVVAASSGDIDTFKVEFEAFNGACFACHDFKPSSGGVFRFPFGEQKRRKRCSGHTFRVLKRAGDLALRAIQRDPADPWTHVAAGYVHFARRGFEESLRTPSETVRSGDGNPTIGFPPAGGFGPLFPSKNGRSGR
jgi:cytochrome c556